MTSQEFHIIAEAILLYYQERQSLFADQVVSEKLKVSPSVIRGKLNDRFGCSPEILVKYLESDQIKSRIEKTRSRMLDHAASDDVNGVIIEPLPENGEQEVFYCFADTPYGDVIIASTGSGVCYLAFADRGEAAAVESLRKRFKNIRFEKSPDRYQKAALDFFYGRYPESGAIKLQLSGTEFQLSVWRKLLQIPAGGLMSYSALAGNRKDSHAFGNAVGRNPVAFIVPCHRVVPASGEPGEYHWGRARKAAMICMEAIAAERKEQIISDH